MPSTTSHPSPEELRDFSLGRCDPADLEVVGAHITECGLCQARLDEGLGDDSLVACLREGYEDAAEDRPPAPSPFDLEVIGDYRIIATIGSGGMGTVFEAEHRILRRRVALKLLPVLASADPRSLARFHRETRAVAQLHHTNIVPLLEAGRDRGYSYYSMPRISGQGLDRLLKESGRSHEGRDGARSTALVDRISRIKQRSTVASVVSPESGPPAPATNPEPVEPTPPPTTSTAPRGGRSAQRSYDRGVAELGLQVADALVYAHGKGIIHRDIKPSNLLLDADGTIWITDFGLATSTADDEDLTRSGELLGTLRYLAPERFDGRADARSDVYSLGLTLYELLTFRPAFLATDGPELVRQVLQETPPAPRLLRPGLPRDLETIVLKAAAREPSGRYQSAAALARDLRRFLAGEPILARPLSPLGRAWRWARRRPTIASLTVALALALLGGTIVSARFAQMAGRRAELARIKEHEALEARDQAQTSRLDLGRTSADLLLDRGLAVAAQGRVEESLHWMHAALATAPDAPFQQLIRTHLASWGTRIATLTHWLETDHTRVAFAPDGRTLVTAGRSGQRTGELRQTLQFWDLATGNADGPEIVLEDLDLSGLVFSPDGRSLLAGNGTIQVYQDHPGWISRWDVATRSLVGKVQGHTDCVLAVAWAPDGQRYYSASRDKTVRVWDAASNAPVGEPLVHPGEVRALAPSPDGRWLLTMTRDVALVWNVATGQKVATIPPEPGVFLTEIAFTADGRSLLLGKKSHDGLAYEIARHAWDAATGCLGKRPQVIPQTQGKFTVLRDGRVALGRPTDPTGTWSLNRDDGLQVFHRDSTGYSSAELIRLEPEPVGSGLLSAAFDARRSAVLLPVSGSDRLVVRSLNQPSAPVVEVKHEPVYGRSLLAFAPAGDRVATVPGGALGDAIQIWDAATGRPIGPPVPHRNHPLTFAFNPSGQILASGGLIHEVGLWDVARGQPIGQPMRQGDIVTSLEFAPEDGLLAVGNWSGQVQVWDYATQSRRYPPLTHQDRVSRVRFSPDGSRLAVVCSNAVTLWNPRDGRKVATLKFAIPADPGRVELDPDAVFSPDGRVLLITSGFGSFRFWNAETGQALGPPTPVKPTQRTWFAFSPGGQLVVAASQLGTAQVWDVATTRPLGAPSVQPPHVTGVTFSGENSYVVASSDATLRAWDVPVPLAGNEAEIALSLRLQTGLRRDDGNAVVPLARAEWQALRDQGQTRFGPAAR